MGLRKSILLFIIILASIISSGQGNRFSDSLEVLLLQTDEPEKKIDYLIQLAANYYYKSDLDKAMERAVMARDMAIENGMDLYLAQSHDGIGTIFYDLGNQTKSSENFFASLKIYEKLNNKDGIGATFCRIGTLYLDQKEYEKAADYYLRSIELAREIDSKVGIASNLNNLAKVYSETHEYEKALQTYQEALQINIQSGVSYLEASNYLNIADVYLKMKNFKAAIENIEQARIIFAEIGNKIRLAKSQLMLSEIYMENGSSNYSRQLAEEALGIGLDHGYKEITIAAASILNRIYLASGDSAAAFRYYLLEKQFEDSLFLAEKQKTLNALELQYRFEKNEQAQKIAQQKKNAAIFIITGFLFFSIIILFLLMKQYRLRAKKLQLEKAVFERELEFKNKEMVLNVMSLMKKNEMLSDLSEKLILIEKEATSPESRDTLKKVAKELQKNQEEEIWKEFSTRFKEVHGEFYDKLLKKFPTLTPNELKLCAFLRLNMSSKDIAELTGQRVSSLETARYRLRQKLGIANSDVNLITYLSSI
jgi:tetratricopeptide (TPR) repeat protein